MERPTVAISTLDARPSAASDCSERCSDVVHGAPSRFTDPARPSFPAARRIRPGSAGIPGREITREARNDSELAALKRLSEEARRMESTARGPSVGAWIEQERDDSHRHGGMTVAGPAKPRKKPKRPRRKNQLSLF